MTILLRWLVDRSWIFYAICAVGIVIYFLRVLSARRERTLAMFTLERETATARLIQASTMVLVFVAIGAIVFVSTTFILPTLPIYGAGTPSATPTLAAGVQPSTLVATPLPSPTLGLVVPTEVSTGVVVPSLPPPEPTEAPTPAPAETLPGAISGEVRVQFSNFAELVGYSLLTADVTAAQPVPLTLYWRALEGVSPVNYEVFTHLLAEDGHMVAQHDGPPAGGTRPTTTWTPGESIVDPHSMAFGDPAYTGPTRIAVGLYDPATGRVLTVTGDDRVVLPITINVLPQ
jgi:hypothetical protein